MVSFSVFQTNKVEVRNHSKKFLTHQVFIYIFIDPMKPLGTIDSVVLFFHNASIR